MENVSIANALAPQGQNVSAGKASDGVVDGGSQFGMLLTQQLQQILTQGAMVEMAPGLEGEAVSDGVLSDAVQMPVLEAGTKAAGAEVGLRDVLLSQATGQAGISLSKLARGIGKTGDPAEDIGKKLPPGLPVESKSESGSVVDDAVLASMVAAQVATQVRQPVPQTGSSRAEGSIVVERQSVVLESGMGRGAAAKEAELHAVVSSEVPVTSQANPQSFSALMAERTTSYASATAMPALEIPQRVDSSQWGNALGDKVVWMVGSQSQGAELRLNPPALGPLEVRVSMNDGQATLSFVTQHAPVREAIEAATPRLREMLAESGISLGGVSVNLGTFAQQQPGSQEQFQQRSSAGHWSTNFDEDDAGFAPQAPTSVRYLRDGGMVDLFA